MKKTQMIDKSNFDNKQYKADLQNAYDSGYVTGAIKELENLKSEILSNWFIAEDDYYSNLIANSILLRFDKHISELKGDKCDNNHDCEHCDWVECPN